MSAPISGSGSRVTWNDPVRVAGLMLLFALAAGTARAQDAPAGTPAAEPERAPGAAATADEAVQPETKEVKNEKSTAGKAEEKAEEKTEEKTQEEKPVEFRPTEEISEDLSTALPADI